MAFPARVDETIAANAPLDGSTAALERAPRIIKRYANRKLYDTVASRYVTLEEIGEMVRLGLDCQVVDHASGRDLTTVALAHIIFTEELRDSARQRVTFTDVLRGPGPHAGSDVRGSVTRRPRRADLEAALHAAERRVHHLVSQGHRMRACASEMVRTSEEAVARLHSVASDRVEAAHEVVAGLARLRTELSRIERRIDAYHERLCELDER